MVGSPYREAVRLLELAAAYWSEIDAHYYQIDLLDLPIYRQFNLIHTWFWDRVKQDEEKSVMFENMLKEPMEWEKRSKTVSARVADDEIALMRAAAGE